MSTLANILHHTRPSTHRKPAFIWGDRAWSYADVDRLSDRVAHGLASCDVRPHDHVALHMRNRPELVFSYFACFKLGATVIPINTRFRSEEVNYVLRHSGATTYLAEIELSRVLTVTAPAIRRSFLVDSTGDARFDALLEPGGGEVVSEGVEPDWPAAILYTSGTVAHPKGVLHTHHTLGNAARYATQSLLNSDDVVGIPSSMVHAAGLLAMLTAVRCGTTSVILPPSPHAIVAAVERHRITAMLGLPAMFWELLDAEKARPGALASLRSAVVCGDVIPQLLEERFRSQCGICLKPHYGMTEVFPVTYSRLDSESDGSLGRAIPGVDVRVVDGLGHEVPAGNVGELEVRSDSVMREYWRDADGTRAVLRDGWLRTGDLASEGPSGSLWFAGRKKDLIVRGGSKVSPVEVEEVLRSHPAVKDAAVIGAPDPVLGHIVAASIVMREGHAVDTGAIREFVRARLADYKVPEFVLVTDALPKTAAGKLARKEVVASIVERLWTETLALTARTT